MAFNLEILFVDVFAPADEEVTIMYDLPTASIPDNDGWLARRKMAEEWHQKIKSFANKYKIKVNPVITYEAQGAHNMDLPEYGLCEAKRINIAEIVNQSTIILSMPEFSASAPLLIFTQKNQNLRVASMPMVTKTMEQTGLAADYNLIADECKNLARLFENAIGVELLFSTGHQCYFDISDNKTPLQDNGRLHKTTFAGDTRLRNLPSGEVCVTPNENPKSLTRGQLPIMQNGQLLVLNVEQNKIVGVEGKSKEARQKHREFMDEPAMCNIAEVAIGCNDMADVTGNLLEDEKAGFHWAYGRSDHLQGKIGVKDFSSPEKVIHLDFVYAKGNPIVCKKFEFIHTDGQRTLAIRDGARLEFYI
jgi:leucyl aminopeptidase (aminopeptidase T)